jgi:phage protein D
VDAITYKFRISYNSKNITEDISKHLLRISYTDNVTGVADLLEIDLEDTDNKWCNEWYPEKGAVLNLQLGYTTGPLIKPNAFEISNINLSGSKDGGDVVKMQSVGAGINKQLKTKNSHAHENKTLAEIVNGVAAKYGLTVIGDVPHIAIGRVTQRRKNDLVFLQRLADEYGCAFNVKGDKLTFMPFKDLESIKRVATIDKTDCIEWDVNDKGFEIFNRATVRSHNPNKNKVIQSTYSVSQVANNDKIEFAYLTKGNNSLEVRTKTENEQQANAKSEAALHKHNSLQQTAIMKLPGNTALLAGCNVEITGFGKLSGIWHILKSVHVINKMDGYTTDIELKRIIPATISKSRKAPRKISAKSKNYEVVNINNDDGLPFSYLK